MLLPSSRYATVSEVAAYFNVSNKTVHRWLGEGLLQGIAVNRGRSGRTTWRVSTASVREFEADGLNSATS